MIKIHVSTYAAWSRHLAAVSTCLEVISDPPEIEFKRNKCSVNLIPFRLREIVCTTKSYLPFLTAFERYPTVIFVSKQCNPWPCIFSCWCSRNNSSDWHFWQSTSFIYCKQTSFNRTIWRWPFLCTESTFGWLKTERCKTFEKIYRKESDWNRTV